MQMEVLTLLIIYVLCFSVSYSIAKETIINADGMSNDINVNNNIENDFYAGLEPILVEVEHSFDLIHFEKRNDFKLSYNNEGILKITELSEVKFNNNEIFQLKELLSNNGLYRLRMKATPNNATSLYVSTSIPACDLQKSGFKEDIQIHCIRSVKH